MAGIIELKSLLANMRPTLSGPEYVFCSTSSLGIKDSLALDPLCMVKEEEGITLVLEQHHAEAAGLSFNGIFRKITLEVHSSLEAVGLTAAVASALAEEGISANVVAAYYHDHIFVPADKSDQALNILLSLTARA